MNDIDVLPLIVDLIGSFYRSSLDALGRAKTAAYSHPFRERTGLTTFSERDAETQATLESVVASFIAIESIINYAFFNEIDHKPSQSGLDRWLKQKWKGNLSILDRFNLLFSKYATTELARFQSVTSIFQEFVTFRNRIVHPHPEKYDALVERSDIPGEVLIHAVEPFVTRKPFQSSGLSEEIGRIAYPDAARCHEIMLLVFALIDGQLVIDLQLSWYEAPSEMTGCNSGTPAELLESLEHRYYPKIDPKTFIPEFIAKLKQEHE